MNNIFITFTDMRNINFGKLVKMLNTEKEQINFLQDAGIFKKSRNCSSCDENLNVIHQEKKYFYFFCNKCKIKISIRKDTILSNVNVSMRKFILLVYVFVSNFWTYQQIKVILEIIIEFLMLCFCTERN